MPIDVTTIASYKILKEIGIKFKEIILEKSPSNAEEVTKFFKCNLSQVIKTILCVNNKDERVLVSLCGDNQIDLSKLSEATNIKGLKLAKPAETKKIVGLEVGGITPILEEVFCNNINAVVFDERTLNFDKVNIGSGVPEVGYELSTAELKLLIDRLNAKVATVRKPLVQKEEKVEEIKQANVPRPQ